MGTLELVVVAFALAADAFAVAVAQGLRTRRPTWRDTMRIALAFGLFQGLMPLAGWALASWFAGAVTGIAPWIAFGMLAFVGVHMIRESLGHDEPAPDGLDEPQGPDASAAVSSVTPAGGVAVAVRTETRRPIALRVVLPLAVATSIDAAASGVTFAVIGVPILPAVGLVALVTFALSAVGVRIGARVGERLGRWATFAGGVVLVLIGLRILVAHLL